ncbi:cupin domain-containing protein [Amycolatopsis alkalitolerans]|uniref:Cupin domain-containing protein n=1 Tax=Amycolatopsis alkalitolerans TaxID=2547244 RepID=A0A5C4M2M5_9PSEU|nr:cupin domain-containing protein [Amycolatopsis alkalitolerans]
MADLVVDGRSSDPHVPETDFRWSRFAEGALLRSPHPYAGAGASISCSLTTLDRLADTFEVPVTSLFRGADTPREAVYTPAGAGARTVQRGTRVGHDYTLLGALRGPHKRMEAHLVTLTERSEEFPLFQHPGTELLFMLEGEMVYAHGDAGYTMRPGDALQLDGEGVHGPQELIRLPIRFLSVVAYGEGAPD